MNDADGQSDEWVPPALSGGSRSNVNESLLEQWGDQPDASHDVVILVGVDELSSDVLGVDGLEPIPYQPGMFKASMSGADLLSLAANPSVEDIIPDEDVTAL